MAGQGGPAAVPVWVSKRPRMWECSEAQFMEDLCAFHCERNGKKVTPETSPDAILNGSRLDLYNLYKETHPEDMVRDPCAICGGSSALA
ncbi:hypothetical protein COCSUDRAFT_62200 [Coccomyxa subellipsoidea C-169]|uniref:Uncharacterized protein n=1 Tax=Coccomyxa subellipsoidea (strain C-169) TaxID=574566 RepID=I0Z2C1_COCSC|nr:hypothetical protein COCSUDRAFT_62200 [Coccomyxa subellipsoidea C-169]EIE24790.1 hypothetical protein COCSUDRAFT_62200 [Coccomyxa subellipsoidea C-169]|eukprot:XP_005649334.1 hypothetical protein COCSUDRAFT_62200 [Coccomyxa subellipsoidea C-169]